MLSFFVPSMFSEAVGMEAIGPTPQMMWLAFVGGRNNDRLTSPIYTRGKVGHLNYRNNGSGN